MNHGVGPLKILLDKTGNPLLKDREYQSYWNLKLKLGKITDNEEIQSTIKT